MSAATDDDKYDDGIAVAFDDADEEAQTYVRQYYESLCHDDLGNVFFFFSTGNLRSSITVQTFRWIVPFTLLHARSTNSAVQR